MFNSNSPLIGITSRSRRYDSWSVSSLGSWMDFVYQEYNRSILAAGGVPTGIPVGLKEDAVKIIIDRIDGLLVSGGPDIHPPLYGQEAQPGLGVVFHELDELDISLVRHALKAGLPVFGICRGIQIMAAAFGGELYQDIDSQGPQEILHTQTAANDAFAHRIQIQPDSKLAEIVGDVSIWVNSHHHQAIKVPPEGFRTVAWAGDNTIEAIEKTDAPFCLGVQWHPEGTAPTDPASQRLFSAFVKAAADKRGRLKEANPENSTPKAAGF